MMMRPRRALDYRRLRRTNSTTEVEASSTVGQNLPKRSGQRSTKSPSEGRSNCSEKKVKLPWYSLMFGLIRFPTEMELKDIRNRQLRQTSSALFPVVEKLSAHRHRSGWKEAAWRLISVLSCKNHANVAVRMSPNA
ncbi:hypothetical protein Ancab_017762 [Ancistrocladus abbreviatus]